MASYGSVGPPPRRSSDVGVSPSRSPFPPADVVQQQQQQQHNHHHHHHQHPQPHISMSYDDDTPSRAGSGVLMTPGTARAARSLASASLAVNVGLFVFKVWVAVTANSMAVVASAVDSLLDMVSQLIILLAMHGQRNVNRTLWPLGRARLEPVGVVVVAALMGSAALQILWESAIRLFEGWRDTNMREVPKLDRAGLSMLLFAVAIKAVLFWACKRYSQQSSSMAALAEDHRNDVLSNSVAVVVAGVAQWHHSLWWFDPVGAIGISVYICYTWLEVGREQADQLVGRAADPALLRRIAEMSDSHHADMRVDVVRGYHVGPKVFVELEVILPGDSSLILAHDTALDLQKRVEALPEVERAHVHVDYMSRGGEDEHKDLSFADGHGDGEHEHEHEHEHGAAGDEV